MESNQNLKDFEIFLEQQIKIEQYAKAVCEKADIEYNFKCPCCGGIATASKSSLSGAVHASCSICNIDVLKF